MFQSAPAPSARILPGRAWASAPSTRSGTMWPKTWRSATGAGRTAFRMLTGEDTREEGQRGGIVGDVRRDHAFEGVAGIGLAVDDRAIDAPAAHRVAAGEVHLHMVIADRDGGRELDRLIVAVGQELIRPAPLRQRLDPLTHGIAGAGEDECAEPSSEPMPDFVHHVDEPAMADLVAGGERIEVADHLVRLAHIVAQDLHQVAVDLALLARTS